MPGKLNKGIVLNNLIDYLRLNHEDSLVVSLARVAYALNISVSYLYGSIVPLFNEQIEDWKFERGVFLRKIRSFKD